MIGKISGRIDYVAEDHVLIDAGGVGYVVYAAPRTLARLPAAGGVAALYTEMVVREDLMQLIGFATLLEKEWHRLLTTVQGVGAKASLAILDTLGPDGVSRAIALGDATAIKAAPGVGPKLAQRIVSELRDKAPNVMALGARAARAATPPTDIDEGGTEAAAPVTEPPDPSPARTESDAAAQAEADAISALINLGVPPTEAMAAAATAAAEAALADAPPDAATVIKIALKRLG